jgi:hypothetical protein
LEIQKAELESKSDDQDTSEDDSDLSPNLNRVNGPQHYHNAHSEEESSESAEEL